MYCVANSCARKQICSQTKRRERERERARHLLVRRNIVAETLLIRTRKGHSVSPAIVLVALPGDQVAGQRPGKGNNRRQRYWRVSDLSARARAQQTGTEGLPFARARSISKELSLFDLCGRKSFLIVFSYERLARLNPSQLCAINPSKCRRVVASLPQPAAGRAPRLG